LFVSQGRAIVTLLLENNRESFNLRFGDIIRIPAGTPFYIINKDENQKLSIAQLIQPVSTPGHFEDFFGAGGQNPQSFFSAFSNNILEAIFQTKSDEIQKVFGQDQGAIIKAS
ncbi:cupin domain-containing protein, partial [Acinetobacter baumannii]|uniref:cupin domain-containing protein n=1 Tax=Acinetobacter baumannii TaxID=470 RepID=UPI0011145D25